MFAGQSPSGLEIQGLKDLVDNLRSQKINGAVSASASASVSVSALFIAGFNRNPYF